MATHRNLRIVRPEPWDVGSSDPVHSEARSSPHDCHERPEKRILLEKLAEAREIAKKISGSQPTLALDAPLARIRALLSLDHGWGGSDEEPPGTQACSNAVSVLTSCYTWTALLPDRISPSVEGGVVLYYLGHHGRYIFFECYNQGEIVHVKSTGQMRPEVSLVEFAQLLESKFWTVPRSFVTEGV